VNGKHIAGFARRAIRMLRRLYWPLAAAFLAYALYRAGDLLPLVIAHARLDLLACATLLWLALHLLTPAFSCSVLRDGGAVITYAQALRIHVSRLPARYLPGGIWHTVSRVADLHEMGIDRARLARLVAIENSVPLGVAAIAGGTCIAATGTVGIGMAGVAVGALLLCLIPFASRHRHLGGSVRMSVRGYAIAVLSSAMFWTAAAIAFACYWSAYPATAGHASPVRIAGVYLLAWAAGFASVFAPQGVGVFEAVTGVLLKGALPVAGTALVAAGFRLIILAADMSAFALLHVLRQSRETVPSVIDHPPKPRL